uniref:Microtubule-associated protein Jupiter n=1 Tax=Rodentolepis nana TaxID=102285 RepID=A0A0R3TFJ7_RODNA
LMELEMNKKADSPDGDSQLDGTQGTKFHHRPPTSSGARNMQDSSFALSGSQFDDKMPSRTSTRTMQPPGGKSTSLW